MAGTSIAPIGTNAIAGVAPGATRTVALDSVNPGLVPSVRVANRPSGNPDRSILLAAQAGDKGVVVTKSSTVTPLGGNANLDGSASARWRATHPDGGRRSSSNQFKAADRNNPPTVTIASRTGAAGSNAEVPVGKSANPGKPAAADGSSGNKTKPTASESALADAQKMLGNIHTTLKGYLGENFSAPTNHAGWCAAVAQVAGGLKGTAKTEFLAKIQTDAKAFGLNFGQSSIALSQADFAKLDAAHREVNSSLFSEWKANVQTDPKTTGANAKQTAAGQETLTADKALEVAKKLDIDGDNIITTEEAKTIPAVSAMWSQWAPEGSMSVDKFAEKLFTTVNQNASATDAQPTTNTPPDTPSNIPTNGTVAAAGTPSLTAMLTAVQGQSEEQTLAMVNGWDTGKDGNISRAELATVCPEAEAAWDSFAKGKTEISLSECAQLMRATAAIPSAPSSDTDPAEEPKVPVLTDPNSNVG